MCGNDECEINEIIASYCWDSNPNFYFSFVFFQPQNILLSALTTELKLKLLLRWFFIVQQTTRVSSFTRDLERVIFRLALFAFLTFHFSFPRLRRLLSGILLQLMMNFLRAL